MGIFSRPARPIRDDKLLQPHTYTTILVFFIFFLFCLFLAHTNATEPKPNNAGVVVGLETVFPPVTFRKNCFDKRCSRAGCSRRFLSRSHQNGSKAHGHTSAVFLRMGCSLNKTHWGCYFPPKKKPLATPVEYSSTNETDTCLGTRFFVSIHNKSAHEWRKT